MNSTYPERMRSSAQAFRGSLCTRRAIISGDESDFGRGLMPRNTSEAFFLKRDPASRFTSVVRNAVDYP